LDSTSTKNNPVAGFEEYGYESYSTKKKGSFLCVNMFSTKNLPHQFGQPGDYDYDENMSWQRRWSLL
jgi:hypothetical protein